MSLGISVTKKNNSSASARRVVKFTADGSYATDGYALSPAAVELGTIDAVLIAGVSSGGFTMRYSTTTGKLKCFKVGADGPLTECAVNEATLANEVFNAIVEGDQVNNG